MPDSAATDFQAVQRAFAQHLRDPQQVAAPDGIEDRRMAIYRRLFINNVQGFLAQAFPVLHAVTPDEQWTDMVRRFYAQHRCHRPQFYQVAEEFLDFLQTDQDEQAPPYRLELAHYEWIELVLAIDPTPAPDFQDCELLQPDQALVFSPWLRLLHYAWPVHQIGPEFQPDSQPDQVTSLLVFRALDDDVHFLQLNLLSARLLELLIPGKDSLDAVLPQLAKEAGVATQAIQGFAQEMLVDLQQRGAILGLAAG